MDWIGFGKERVGEVGGGVLVGREGKGGRGGVLASWRKRRKGDVMGMRIDGRLCNCNSSSSILVAKIILLNLLYIIPVSLTLIHCLAI
jgi:hypothetical protein